MCCDRKENVLPLVSAFITRFPDQSYFCIPIFKYIAMKVSMGMFEIKLYFQNVCTQRLLVFESYFTTLKTKNLSYKRNSDTQGV